jgi:hypothetical protein
MSHHAHRTAATLGLSLTRALTGCAASTDGQPTGEPNVTVHILGTKAPTLNACGGPESVAELKRIIDTGGIFRVEYDPQSGRVDSKGRTQGYLYSGDGSGIPMVVGPHTIDNGYAVAWYDGATENRSTELTKTAQAQKDYAVRTNDESTKIAQSRKYGIWATCPATVSGPALPVVSTLRRPAVSPIRSRALGWAVSFWAVTSNSR